MLLGWPLSTHWQHITWEGMFHSPFSLYHLCCLSSDVIWQESSADSWTWSLTQLANFISEQHNHGKLGLYFSKHKSKELLWLDFLYESYQETVKTFEREMIKAKPVLWNNKLLLRATLTARSPISFPERPVMEFVPGLSASDEIIWPNGPFSKGNI